MVKGFFITGTDTGVGKTLAAGGLAALYKERGRNVGVMKPISTGCKKRNNSLVSDDAVFLQRMADANDEYELINPISLEHPFAPTVAAKLGNAVIDLEKVRTAFDVLCKRHELLIVEGIGGLLVPIEEYYFVVDLADEMELPLIVVCQSGLGTINHTLLTISYARQHGLDIKGIIVNDSRGTPEEVIKSNTNEIRRITNLPILGTIPHYKGLDINNDDENAIIKFFRDNIDLNIII